MYTVPQVESILGESVLGPPPPLIDPLLCDYTVKAFFMITLPTDMVKQRVCLKLFSRTKIHSGIIVSKSLPSEHSAFADMPTPNLMFEDDGHVFRVFVYGEMLQTFAPPHSFGPYPFIPYAHPFYTPKQDSFNAWMHLGAISCLNHHKVSSVIGGFSVGRSLRFEGDRSALVSKPNPVLNTTHSSFLSSQIESDVDKALVCPIASSMDSVPISRFSSSPLFVNTKRSSGKMRGIHDPTATGINKHIPKRDMKSTTVEHAASIARQLGPGTLMAKVDCSSAYNVNKNAPFDLLLLLFF